MRQRRRPFKLIPVILASLLSLLYLVLNISPSSQLIILNLNISYVYLFFSLIFIFVYTLFSFVFANKRRGLFMALLAILYLILRLNNLNSLYFALLLVILFGALELLFIKRK